MTSDVPFFLGGGKPVYFDGISKYFVNYEGNVYRHEVTNIAINGIQQEMPLANWQFNMQLARGQVATPAGI